MEAEVRFESAAAIAVFADEGAVSGMGARDPAEAESLRSRAEAGEAFVVETKNPRITGSRQRRASGRFRIYLDEPVPEEIEEVCFSRSGQYLLRLPSGRLQVSVAGKKSRGRAVAPETRTVEVPPGDYSVSLLDGSSKNAPAVTAQQETLVDAADWRLYERINHFGAFGCLFIALGMIFVLFPQTRREYWYLLPLFLLPTCAFSFLRRLPGYARVAERIREHEARLPQYVIVMRRVDSTEGLEGGWYQCQ